MLNNLQAIVLAAGQSKRLQSGSTKLIETICGRELVLYPTILLEKMGIPTIAVVGFQKEAVMSVIERQHNNRIQFVVQEEQHGKGHALWCSRDYWSKDHLLILSADIPLITQEIIETLYTQHINTNAAISFVMAHNSDPSSASYGRVVKTQHGIHIEQEFDGDMHEHCCINAGIYIVSKEFISQHINEIDHNERTKEFFITDLIKIASDTNRTITTISAPFDQIRGIDTYQELWAAEQVKRSEIVKYWMLQGVRFFTPHAVHVDIDVEIEPGTFIGAGVHLFNGTRIGRNCTIEAFSMIRNSIIADKSTIFSHSVVTDSTIGTNTQVGPFAFLNGQVTIGNHTTIGSFVEAKRSSIGDFTKAKHLTYLGDATVGSQVNIGAGTITCNHDGQNKHKTIIKDHAYIGSNNSLVAPVTIEEEAFTAAGSVITQDVPAHALAIARSRQTNKRGYALKLRQKKTDILAHTTTQHDEQEKNNLTDSLSFFGAIKTDADTQVTE